MLMVLGYISLTYVRQRTDCAELFGHAVFLGSTSESLAVAIMCRLVLGLALLGMASAAYAAEPGNGVVIVPSLDLLTVQTVQFDAGGPARISRYRFTASVVPIHPADTAPFGLQFSNSRRLTPAAEGQKEIAWATNSSLVRFFGSDRAALSPRLRVESGGQRLEIVPRRHSVWIQWRKELP
jgi:hypothetical protein